MTDSARQGDGGGDDGQNAASPSANGVAPAAAAPDENRIPEDPPGCCAKLFCRRSNRVGDSYQANQGAEAAAAPAAAAPMQTASTPASTTPADNKIIFDKSSDCYYRWIVVVSLAFIYNLTFNILRAVFYEVHWMMGGRAWIVWIVFDVIADIIYLAEIFIKLRTGFLEQGLLVRDLSRIQPLYIKSWDFRLDVFSILPFDYLVGLIMMKPFPAGRFVRLFRVMRFNNALDRTETRTAFPNVFRVLCVIFYIVVIIHWNACFYFFISECIGIGSDTWVYGEKNKQSLPDGVKDGFWRRYVYSFYWSTLTLTTIGEVPGPVQNIEFLFVTCDLMCGVLIFATIVGNVGSMISNMSAGRAEFQNKMDGVKQYMALRKVSKALEERVIKWFDYLWSNKQSLNDEGVLKVLPDKLQAEIAMHVHFETLRKVRIFQDCESGLLAELVLRLQLQVFSPGDYICRKGDIGREMYIVKRGKLQVVSNESEDAEIFATLQEGSVFGELSILNIRGSIHGNRRTANVRSVGYTDLFVLNKTDLWVALKEYPEARKMLLAKGRELLRKDNLLDENAAADQATPDELIDELVAAIDLLQTRIARLTAEKTNTEAKLNARIAMMERDMDKYRKKRLARQAEARFGRSNTLTADFDPHDVMPADERPGTSYIEPIDPRTKKTN